VSHLKRETGEGKGDGERGKWEKRHSKCRKLINEPSEIEALSPGLRNGEINHGGDARGGVVSEGVRAGRERRGGGGIRGGRVKAAN